MSRNRIYKVTPLSERFWKKVRITESCWLWTAAVNNKGYGVFHSPMGRLAHRYSWVLSGNRDPGKLFLLHSCDTPLCVRPDHLRVGTMAENMHDALLRGHENGRPHGRSKLTPDNVRAIRTMCKPGINDLAEIAAKFGITKGAVGHIKYGVSWGWLQ